MELDSDSDLPNTIGSGISMTQKQNVHGPSGQIPTIASYNSNDLLHSDETYPRPRPSNSASADFVMVPKTANYKRRRNTSLAVQALITASQNLSHQNALSLPNTNSFHSNYNPSMKKKPRKKNQHHIISHPQETNNLRSKLGHSTTYKSRKRTRTRIQEPNQKRKRSKRVPADSISHSFGNTCTNSMQLYQYLYAVLFYDTNVFLLNTTKRCTSIQ